jgi:hypothetical protein
VTEARTIDQRCKCCGANPDGSYDFSLTIVGDCDCTARAPTVPVYRNPGEHLPDCRLLVLGRFMLRNLAFHSGATIEVTEL